jgi:hypothetical protein
LGGVEVGWQCTCSLLLLDRRDPGREELSPDLHVHRVVGIGLERLPHEEARVLALVEQPALTVGEPAGIGDRAGAQRA